MNAKIDRVSTIECPSVFLLCAASLSLGRFSFANCSVALALKLRLGTLLPFALVAAIGIVVFYAAALVISGLMHCSKKYVCYENVNGRRSNGSDHHQFALE
jgi:hypothetical protein